MKRIIIQLWQANLSNPQLAATPFFFASAAAAMGMHVEVHVLGPSIEMFIENNEQRHSSIPPLNRKLSEFIDDAVRTGVQFYACSTAMRDRQLELKDLTEGFEGIIGMVTMLDRATQENTTVFTF